MRKIIDVNISANKVIGEAFCFVVISAPDLEIKSYSDWKKHLLSDEFEIYNEEHEKIEKSDFLR